MKMLLYLAPFLLLMACGEKENEVEKLDLEDYKAKLSYAFGAQNAESILTANPEFKKLDKDLLKQGFESNLNENNPQDCEQTMISFLGPYMQDFDTTYVKDGSECIGRYAAYGFFMQMKQLEEESAFDWEMVKKGFAHRVMETDTFNLTREKQKETVEQYMKELEAKVRAKEQQKMQANIDAGPAFWEKVEANKAIKEIGSTGIYLETIEAGKGGNPTAESDVVAHYILTTALGDTMESSYNAGQPLRMNLAGLIKGWSEGIPAMKKGGKYRLYVPSEKAYNQGPLCFFIELIDYGPAGTLAPPPQQQMPY